MRPSQLELRGTVADNPIGLASPIGLRMNYAAQLWFFFVLVFGAVIFPGLDVAFILGSTLTGGRRHGLSAVAGVVVGAACHSIIATMGVGVLLEIPGAFNAVLIAGTFYIAWIGIDMLRRASQTVATSELPMLSPWLTLRRAAANNLMNPSAYLFSLAIFPQFIFPKRGFVAAQAFVLFLIIALTQIGVYGTEVLFAARVQRWLATQPRSEVFIKRAVGVMLILAAIATGVASWRRF